MNKTSQDQIDGSKDQAGFNLIELLAAIAVAAVLAAVLLSVINQAKGRALRIECANNARQLGMALQQFKLDYNFYPPQLDPGEHSVNRNWKDAFGNEIGLHHNLYQEGIWHCPAASRPTSPDWNTNQNRVYNEYGYNAFGLGAYASTNSLGLSEYWWMGLGIKPLESISRVREPEVICPAEMYAIGDAFYGGPDVVRDGVSSLGRASDRAILSEAFTGYNFSEGTKRSYARHQDCANIVFCDGHMEAPTLQFLFVSTNDVSLVRWNRDHLPHDERLSP